MTEQQSVSERRSVPGPWVLAAVRAARPFALVAAGRPMIGRQRMPNNPDGGRFMRPEVNQIVGRAFSHFERRVVDLPAEPTLGSRQNVTLAALTLSFLQAIEEAGIERGYAIELTGDTCWRFYRQWGHVTKAATRLTTRDPVRRLRLSVNAFLTFPFGRPGYRFDDCSRTTDAR